MLVRAARRSAGADRARAQWAVAAAAVRRVSTATAARTMTAAGSGVSVPAGARIFSGIQPTGALHLGNYLGAVRQWVQLQNQHHAAVTASAAAPAAAPAAAAAAAAPATSASHNKPLFALVDLHALTVRQEPEALRAETRNMAATLLACGLRPDRSALFAQSQVRAHAELCWVLGCVTPHSWMKNMTQFKEKSARIKQRAAAPAPALALAAGSIAGADAIDAAAPSLGLFVYPVLQTADILLYRATHVPVGDDQRQHLELARRIAQRFNALYPSPAPAAAAGGSAAAGHAGADAGAFSVPEALFLRSNARVMSLRDPNVKMSKSDPIAAARIALDDDADTIAAKLRRATTDAITPVAYPHDAPDDSVSGSGSGDAAAAASSGGSRPAVANLMRIYAALTNTPVCAPQNVFADHTRFKAALTDAVVAHLAPIRAELLRLKADPAYVDSVLRDGQRHAEPIAEQTMTRVRHAMGLPPRL